MWKALLVNSKYAILIESSLTSDVSQKGRHKTFANNSYRRSISIVFTMLFVCLCTDDWFEFILGIELADVGRKYVLSLYWAIATATSTGYVLPDKLFILLIKYIVLESVAGKAGHASTLSIFTWLN